MSQSRENRTPDQTLHELVLRVHELEATEQRLLTRLSEAAHEHTKYRSITQAALQELEGQVGGLEKALSIAKLTLQFTGARDTIRVIDELLKPDARKCKHGIDFYARCVACEFEEKV